MIISWLYVYALAKNKSSYAYTNMKLQVSSFMWWLSGHDSQHNNNIESIPCSTINVIVVLTVVTQQSPHQWPHLQFLPLRYIRMCTMFHPHQGYVHSTNYDGHSGFFGLLLWKYSLSTHSSTVSWVHGYYSYDQFYNV